MNYHNKMNFLFNSCSFDKNISLNQNNCTILPQNRLPFSDITQQMNSFFNYNKNQQINLFTKNFNDFSNPKENFSFLKKKSYEMINYNEKDEENKEQKDIINKPKKNINNNYKTCNSLINNLEEDSEDENKENICGNIFGNNKKRKDELLSLSQILNESINEKKEFDKIERDKKKANKLKQLKMHIKNRKNTLECLYKNNDILNKENINNNTNNLIGFREQRSTKELNMMCLD